MAEIGRSDSVEGLDGAFVADFQGVLHRAEDGNIKKMKRSWGVLSGSSLFFYKQAQKGQPKIIVETKGCTFKPADKPEHAFLIMKDAKESILVQAPSGDEYKQWLEHLEANKDKDAQAPPEFEKKAKASLGNRASKALAGKMAVSGVGKLVIKQGVPDEVSELISALKRLIAQIHGKDKAEDVENNVIKLYVKWHYLEDTGSVTENDIIEIDKSLRNAFETIIKIRDNLHIGRNIPEDKMSEALNRIHSMFKNVEKAMTAILMPHLKTKSIERIGTIFNTIGDVAFLRQALTDSKLNEHMNVLQDAMFQYVQFHF
eukprot:Colp12_sorted_trinity150504_noHs@1251